eukprot:6823757-Alexandrium_andersonii.AAC.1
MCIRDRIRTLREKRRRTQPSGASGTNFDAVPGPAQFQVRMPEAMSVSYTHLRAHETSAHL